MEDKDEDLTAAQDTSLSGQSVRQWEARMMAQDASLNEIANGSLRRLLERNKSTNCAAVKIGDSLLFH